MNKNKQVLNWMLSIAMIMIVMIACKEETSDPQDDDGQKTQDYSVSISTDQSNLEEGERALITISLDETNESGATMNLKYNVGGTAKSGDDFESLSGSVDISDGEKSVSFDLEIIDDEEVEDSESLDIALAASLPEDVSLGINSSLSFVISDNDEDEVVTYILTVTAGLTEVTEGDGQKIEVLFSLDKANESGQDIAITYTMSGTASRGTDYTGSPGSTSIAKGAISATVMITIVDDQDVEGDETIGLALNTPADDNISLGQDLSIEVKIIDNDEEDVVEGSNDISVLASQFYHTDAVTVTYDDEWVTITSKDLPDHKSMYYDESNDLYEAYDEPDNADFKKNQNTIGEQNIVFKLPRYPEEATNKESPGGGPMGVAINSVVFFNQEAAGDDDIFEELNTFDQYEGHPANTTYHYHIEPVWLTEFKGNEAFVGFLLDGFPVYSTHEDGVEITNDDLDDYHGHFSVTADFPDGIYHYHITVEYPWINGDGYYGTPGTKTQ
ncbi:MAG: YHYH protein [Reichenbachiella sp.]